MKRYLLSLLLIASGCGTEPAPVSPTTPTPNPGPGPNPEPTKPDFARMTEIHRQYCIQCHGNSAFIRDETALKNSSAKIRVQNRSMPPNASQLPANIRDEYLSFFSG